MRAIWNGMVIAQSDATVKLEGNNYFPIESGDASHLRESKKRTVCPWNSHGLMSTTTRRQQRDTK